MRSNLYDRWVWFVYEFVVQVVMGLYGLTLVGMSWYELFGRLKTHTNPYQPIPTHTNPYQRITTHTNLLPTHTNREVITGWYDLSTKLWYGL